ncbi:MAG: hypothetical protein V7668_10500 [Cereibacter changlensis]
MARPKARSTDRLSAIGASGAQPARVTRAVHIQVEDLRITVLEVEETVQLVWARKWNAEWKTLFNEFATTMTGPALRALADAVDEATAKL